MTTFLALIFLDLFHIPCLMFAFIYECPNRISCVHSLVLQELLVQEKSQTSAAANQEIDLDELMDVS